MTFSRMMTLPPSLLRCWPQGWAACTPLCPPSWRFPTRSGTAFTKRTGSRCRPSSSFSTRWSSATPSFRWRHVTKAERTWLGRIKNESARGSWLQPSAWLHSWLTRAFFIINLSPGGSSWYQGPAGWLHLQRIPRACPCAGSPQGWCSFSF